MWTVDRSVRDRWWCVKLNRELHPKLMPFSALALVGDIIDVLKYRDLHVTVWALGHIILKATSPGSSRGKLLFIFLWCISLFLWCISPGCLGSISCTFVLSVGIYGLKGARSTAAELRGGETWDLRGGFRLSSFCVFFITSEIVF